MPLNFGRLHCWVLKAHSQFSHTREGGRCGSPLGLGIVGVLCGGKGWHGLREDGQGVLRKPRVLQSPAGRYSLSRVVRQQLVQEVQAGWGRLGQLLQRVVGRVLSAG
jgi:hypothetical protein